MSYTYNNTASSSRPSNFYELRNPTPPKVRQNSPMGRAFPQSLPFDNYPQEFETGLCDYKGKKFAYLQNFGDKTPICKSPDPSRNNPDYVTLGEKKYIYKNNYVDIQYLPENHERTIKKDIEIRYKGISGHYYHSNSRAMAQIMSRDLLELFIGHRDDIILPQIYPVVNKDNGEICGLLSEKIDFEEIKSDSNIKNMNHPLLLHSSSEEVQTRNGIVALMDILGIKDVAENDKIFNLGFTQDNKLVFFDFGYNILDLEYLKRHSKINLSKFYYKKDEENMGVPKKTSSKTKFLKPTANFLVETYLKNYGTKNNKKTGLAKTIHPHINTIIMNTGAGDKNFSNDIAIIVQTRINMVFEDAKKESDELKAPAKNPNKSHGCSIL